MAGFLYVNVILCKYEIMNKRKAPVYAGAFYDVEIRKRVKRFVGRPKKFSSAKALEAAWEEYKSWCNNQVVLTHEFSSKNSEFVSKELRRSITCTIEGFCAHIGLARRAFYDTYANNEKFSHIVTRIREECEVDARMKFELGVVDSRLAGLWMSRYGYTIKSDASVSGAVPVVISGEEDIEGIEEQTKKDLPS